MSELTLEVLRAARGSARYNGEAIDLFAKFQVTAAEDSDKKAQKVAKKR